MKAVESGATLRLLTIGLLALSCLYLCWGLYKLVLGDSFAAAIDLEVRWIDNRYVLSGQNPWDVIRERAPIDPDIGAITIPGGNPPWSYPLGSLVVPPFPQFILTRVWFAALSLLSLGLVAWWAYRGLTPWGRNVAFLGAATVLGQTANLFTLSAGQYGIVLNAALVASLLLYEHGRWRASGTALAFTLLKPHIGGAYVLLHLANGHFRTLAVALAWVLASLVAVAVWIDTSPLEYTRELLTVKSLSGTNWGYGLYSWLSALGVAKMVWLPALGLTGALLAMILLWRYRFSSIWTQVAIVAVIGRLWTYHGVYDNVMLVFLPLALLRCWASGPRSKRLVVAWLAVMATLAAPIPYRPHIDLLALQIAHVTVWIGGLVVLLQAEGNRADESPPEVLRQE